MTVAPSLTAARHHAAAYCLRCYAPLEDASRAAEECRACGTLNTRQARRDLWTVEPGLVALERSCKLVAFVACLGAYAYWSMKLKGIHVGPIIGCPVVFGVLWATASKLTHRMPYFNAGRFWSAVVLVTGLMPAIGMLLGVLLYRSSPRDPALAVAIAVPFWFLSRGVLVLSRRLERWKRKRIAGGAVISIE
jgi:hypothetical protein